MHEAHTQPNHLLETQDHCSNERCEDPNCQNPRCYNYVGHSHARHRYEHHHGYPSHSQEKEQRSHYPNHHYHDVLQNILQRHHHHQDRFSEAQTDVGRHQQSLHIKQLQWVDHVLSGLVRNVLEQSQHELCERGFSSGIHSEVENVTLDHPHHHHDNANAVYNKFSEEEGGNEDSTHEHSSHEHSYQYLIAMALHVNDVPNSDPENNTTSNNQIRFYRVADSLDIQCQFSNTKMQSKVFDLSFHQGEESGAQLLVEDVVQDFISFILLSRRAGLSSVS
jgi:hypothetical protein